MNVPHRTGGKFCSSSSEGEMLSLIGTVVQSCFGNIQGPMSSSKASLSLRTETGIQTFLTKPWGRHPKELLSPFLFSYVVSKHHAMLISAMVGVTSETIVGLPECLPSQALL